MRVLLISTYELGRQPFGLASPAAWLKEDGHDVVLADLSRGPLPVKAASEAEFIGFFLPMHTATRLILRVVERVRSINPSAYLCAYGLYAPLNQDLLCRAGVNAVIGGEFEKPLADLVREAAPQPLISLGRQQFRVPDRTGLPPLASYAQLVVNGDTKRVGYTEASRGCKHWCRHCPVVPVYRGSFRIVQREIVLEDIRRQIALGAQHVTFGDPDFFNGPGHALKVIESLHCEWPTLTYDVTIKIEHMLKHRELLPALKATGCLFVTSAVESLDDAVLEKLSKGHTRADFLEALSLSRAAGLPLAPTFIPFTPWTTRESYQRFLRDLVELDLADQVAPIQLAIRLLIPEGSLLLEQPEIRALVEPFDAHALCYPWRSRESGLDILHASIQELLKREEGRRTRQELFRLILQLAEAGPFPEGDPRPSRATIPYLTEPWYC
ncbi:MAG: radical SAM protein [Terriglobia bacterium]|nr:MAG: radical SAM protein [Terriglobia bacterium]